MDRTQWLDCSLAEIQERRGKGQFSYLELTKAVVQRIKKLNPKINAFITVTEELALQQAKRADALFDQGKNDNPLLGIPFSAKDIFCVKGVQTTASSNVLKGYTPPYTATAIQRLLDAGGVFIGKTNCDSFGHGSSTEHSDFFTTKNPWDLQRVPGGSSGGSAASIAVGLGWASIAGDTGGSIRQPASFCGVSGLKPTYGRVSRYGAIALASSFDTVGPITRSVKDAQTVFNLISGKDKFDATTHEHQQKTTFNHLTIGVPKEFFVKEAASQAEIVRVATEEFVKGGHRLKETTLPSTKYAVAIYQILMTAETSSNLARYDGIRYGFRRSQFHPETKRRIMLGAYVLSAGYYDEYYRLAQKARTKLIQEYQKVFSECDVIIAPTSPIPPFKIGERIRDPLQMYLADAFTLPVNIAGLPSLALPAGFGKDDLPVGMQLIGPQGSDELLLDLGVWYQEQTDWHKRRPKLS